MSKLKNKNEWLVVIDGSYILSSWFQFQPKSFGLGNCGDGMWDDFHCKHV